MKSLNYCQFLTLFLISFILVEVYQMTIINSILNKPKSIKSNKTSNTNEEKKELTYGGLISHKIPIICLPSYLYNITNTLNSSLSENIVESSNIFWLNSGGAKVLSLHHWFKESKLDRTLSHCNALLIQSFEINLDNVLDYEYFNFVKKIYYKIKQINDKGEIFPILATGFGMNLIQMFEANNTKIVLNFKKSNLYESIKMDFMIDDPRKIRMLYFFDGRDVKNLRYGTNSHVYTNSSVSPDAFHKIDKLRNTFKLISMGKFRQDKNKFVTMIEAYRYPFYGILFEPSKFLFDKFNDDILVDFSNEGITISQKILNFLLDEAYKNLFYRAKNKYSKIENLVETKKLFDKTFKGLDIHLLDLKKIISHHINGYFLDFEHSGPLLNIYANKNKLSNLSFVNSTNITSLNITKKKAKYSNTTNKSKLTKSNQNADQIAKKNKKKKSKGKESNEHRNKDKSLRINDLYNNLLLRFENFDF